MFLGDTLHRLAISHAVNDDDARDLSAAAAGDQQAFGRIYDRHAAVVLSLCRRLCASNRPATPAATGEDALQETFMRAFSMLNRFSLPQREEHEGGESGAGGFRGWLYAIARRVCSERNRAANRRSHHEFIARQNGSLANAAREESAVDHAADAEQMDRLTAALEQLEERERLAVHLYYLDSDPVRAAEAALGLSRSGYYKLLARAKDKLAALMREVQTP